MATAREDAEARFPTDIATHRMKVIKDDGIYRHLRFSQPGTRNMSFDILTWPGYLCFCGDMGDYLFMRLEDMLEFFRHDKINPSYWAEKVQAEDKDSGVKEYSEELARAWVKEQMDDRDAPAEVRDQAEMIDFSNGEARLYDSIDSVGWEGFNDHWEANFQDLSLHLVLPRPGVAIKQYDAAKAVARG